MLSGKPPKLPVWKTKTRRLDRMRNRRKKLETATALQTAWKLSTTRGYRISRKLRHRIEHLFGEAKQSHGLRRARYRGLAKMNEQVTLTAIAQNLKRLVKFLNQPPKRASYHAALRTKYSTRWKTLVCLPLLSCIFAASRHFPSLMPVSGLGQNE